MFSSYLRYFKDGGQIDTGALVARTKEDARYFDKQGIATAAGVKRLAAIQAIADTQKAGYTYKFGEDDTHTLVDTTGEKASAKGLARGVNTTSIFPSSNKKEISIVLGLARAGEIFTQPTPTLAAKKTLEPVPNIQVTPQTEAAATTTPAATTTAVATPAPTVPTTTDSTPTENGLESGRTSGDSALTEKGLREIIANKAKEKTASTKNTGLLGSPETKLVVNFSEQDKKVRIAELEASIKEKKEFLDLPREEKLKREKNLLAVTEKQNKYRRELMQNNLLLDRLKGKASAEEVAAQKIKADQVNNRMEKVVVNLLKAPTTAGVKSYLKEKGGNPDIGPGYFRVDNNGKLNINLPKLAAIKDVKTRVLLKELWESNKKLSTLKGVTVYQKGGQLVSKHQNNPVFNTDKNAWVDSAGNVIDIVSYGSKVSPKQYVPNVPLTRPIINVPKLTPASTSFQQKTQSGPLAAAVPSKITINPKPLTSINNLPSTNNAPIKSAVQANTTTNTPAVNLNLATTFTPPQKIETDPLKKTGISLNYVEMNELNTLINNGWSYDTAAQKVLDKRKEPNMSLEEKGTPTAGLSASGIETKYGQVVNFNDIGQLMLGLFRRKLTQVDAPLKQATRRAEPLVMGALRLDPALTNEGRNAEAAIQSGYAGSDSALETLTKRMAGIDRSKAAGERLAKAAEFDLGERLRVLQQTNERNAVIADNEAEATSVQNENLERLYGSRLAAAKNKQEEDNRVRKTIGDYLYARQERIDTLAGQKKTLAAAAAQQDIAKEEAKERAAYISYENANSTYAKTQEAANRAQKIAAAPAGTYTDQEVAQAKYLLPDLLNAAAEAGAKASTAKTTYEGYVKKEKPGILDTYNAAMDKDRANSILLSFFSR
jgi:hypothetical protein